MEEKKKLIHTKEFIYGNNEDNNNNKLTKTEITNVEFRVGLFSILKCELIWIFMDNIDGDLNAHENISHIGKHTLNTKHCRLCTCRRSQ